MLTFPNRWFVNSNAELALAVALLLFGIRHADAQSILYDNTDHVWQSGTAKDVLWIGGFRFENSSFLLYFAQPVRMDAHDNISSVTMPMARDVDSTTTGTFRATLWNMNDSGRPGEEIAELGEIDIDAVERFDFGGKEGPEPPPILPSVTFDHPVSGLTPGDEYFVVLDTSGLDPDNFDFGDLIHGVSSSKIGTNRAGRMFVTRRSVQGVPTRNSAWKYNDYRGHHYFQMSVETADAPYEVLPQAVGSNYQQDFASLGTDASADVVLPQGWSFFDEFVGGDISAADDGDIIFNTLLTDDFPIDRSLEFGASLFNAGMPGDSDRTLAIGTPRTANEATLQLVTELDGAAKGVQLQFDVEAWDAARSLDDPGEAAFNVTLDVDSGSGYELLVDLGLVSTGPRLSPPEGEFVDGNDAAYRTSFDSGPLNVDIPDGAKLRVRWVADRGAETRGWVFGLDNVSLNLSGDRVTIAGDLDRDGSLTTRDIDLLAAGIRDGSDDPMFDINGDEIINLDDHAHWVHDAEIGNTFFGDSNLDGEFNSEDLVAVFQAGEYEDDIAGNSTWAEGDWNGDAEFDSSDLVHAFQEGVYETGAREEIQTVPEPSSSILAACILLVNGMDGLRRRRKACRRSR